MKWWNKKQKESTIQEQAFKEKQHRYTEELVEKALEKLKQFPNQELIWFDPFESWETRLYVQELCYGNLIDEVYLKELCKELNLRFFANVEVEGDYPTLYFERKKEKTLQKTR